MPILQKGPTITAFFGTGDIAICVGRDADGDPNAPENEVVLVRANPHEIGEWTLAFDGKTSDEVDAPIRMVFDKVESVNVMIERLHAVRSNLIGGFVSGPADGLAWSAIAASAYRAYAASTGNKNFRGEEMPAFDDLPFEIRTAWGASVRQVADIMTNGVDAINGDGEQRWTYFRPPMETEARG